MLFTKLTLADFKLFKDKQSFDLAPKNNGSTNQPIILIGGKNGSGKTTFFDAIKLCLYGKNLFGAAISQSSYEQYLADCIHHESDNGLIPTGASVELEFEHAYLGNLNKYSVKRSWHKNGNGSKIVETLEVKQNGAGLQDLEKDQWQEFINGLIPFGISQLFFFDGEKIQNLAEDHKDATELKQSIQSLLRLDLVEKLQTDLSIYETRQVREQSDNKTKIRLKELERENKKLEKKLDQLTQEIAQKRSQLGQIEADIERQEQKISNEGGSFAEKRESLKTERSKLEKEIILIEEKLRELSNKLLPFALSPELCNSLKLSLLKEIEYNKQKLIEKEFTKKLKKLKKNLVLSKALKTASLTEKEKGKLYFAILDEINQNIISKKIQPDFKPTHNLSSVETQKLLMWVDEATKNVPKGLTLLTKKLEKKTKKIQLAENKLSKAPDNDALNPLVTKVNNLYLKKGKLLQQIKNNEAEIKSAEFHFTNSTRNLNNEIERLKTTHKQSSRLGLIKKVQSSLNDYLIQLKDDKTKEFSEVFTSCFTDLLRKKDIVKKIEVDPNDFSILFYKQENKPLPKSKLSAGEKQMFAISVLWSLTKLSGRSLPFIIDTPLGRLDKDHRDNLIGKFFPYASDQIIILSTDTEIDQEYFKLLNPFIAHRYHLNYQEGNTKIEKGYFWETKKELVHGV